jgi:hypothetical protein
MEANEVNKIEDNNNKNNEGKYRSEEEEEDANNMDLDLVVTVNKWCESIYGLDRRKEWEEKEDDSRIELNSAESQR